MLPANRIVSQGEILLPFCSKCGNEVNEKMEYCPKCGASLKIEKTYRETHEKQEKQEKHEKHEKDEKGEKHEKGERSLLWALLGGIVILVIGALSIITTFLGIRDPWRGAFFLVILGVIIVIFAIYGALKATQRNPSP